MADPMAVPCPVVSPSIASDQRLAVGRRRNGQLGEPGEDDEADPDALGLLLDELARGVLRDRQPVGLDVGGAHRSRDVEREDDRRARERDAAHHVRPAGGDGERDESGEQQRDRKVALPPASASGSTERSSATLE